MVTIFSHSGKELSFPRLNVTLYATLSYENNLLCKNSKVAYNILKGRTSFQTRRMWEFYALYCCFLNNQEPKVLFSLKGPRNQS